MQAVAVRASWSLLKVRLIKLPRRRQSPSPKTNGEWAGGSVAAEPRMILCVVVCLLCGCGECCGFDSDVVAEGL